MLIWRKFGKAGLIDSNLYASSVYAKSRGNLSNPTQRTFPRNSDQFLCLDQDLVSLPEKKTSLSSVEKIRSFP